MIHYRTILQKFVLLLFGLSATTAAMADDEPADSLAVMLEELSVTALKHSAFSQSDAGASTILTRPELEQLNAVTLRGISEVVPNFYIPDYGSRITSTIYVRGIGARMDQPSVGLNVDNVPYLNKDAYDFDIIDIASMEMLRGPQSTLYGRNTMAGVINITTLSPMKFQGWRFLLEGGSGERFKANAGWYHRFNHKAALAVTAAYSRQEGFFTNSYNGEKTDRERNVAGRIRFQWQPADGWHLSNSASFGHLRQGGYPYEYKETGRIEYNDTCFYRRFTFADGLTATKSADRLLFTSITSAQIIDDNLTLDQDFLPLDFFTLTQKKKEWAITEDVVVKPHAADSPYSWLAGFFGFYKHLDMSAPVTFLDKGISDLIESHRNDANPGYPISWDSRNFVLNSDFTVPTFGFALYHESSYTFGNVTLTAGIRADYERSALNYHSFCDTGYTIFHTSEGHSEPYRHVDIDIDDRDNLSKDFITILPKIEANWRFECGNLYAKISKGYKAGGFNTQMFSDVLQQRLMRIMGIGAQYDIDDVVSYKPEQSWNYEVGSHLSLADSKLNLELALFYIDCRDQQLTMFPDGTTTGRIMTNAGKTRSFGAEISAIWQPASNFALNGSYGLTNARFRKFFNGISDFKGKVLPYAPANTLFLQAIWSTGFRGHDNTRLSLDVNMRGTGKIYWNEENSEVQPFYILLGAQATLDINHLSIQLWGRNLSDTRYHSFYFLSMGNEFLQRGRGTEIGLTLRLVI